MQAQPLRAVQRPRHGEGRGKVWFVRFWGLLLDVPRDAHDHFAGQTAWRAIFHGVTTQLYDSIVQRIMA